MGVLALTGTISFAALDDGGAAVSAANAAWAARMTESVLRRHPVLHYRWDYTSGLMLTAIEQVWSRTGERRYFDYIKANIDRFVDASGDIDTYDPDEFNLDQINMGKALFLLYRQTGEERYKKALFKLRDQLRSHPRTREGGFWHKQIYPHQMWLDGLYMAAPFYARFAAEFDEPATFDDVVRQITLVHEHTRDPRTGLLYHGWDESRSQIWADRATGCSPHFWGRALGWYVMALVDVLDFLPHDHPGCARVLRILDGTMAAVQDKETGLWHQVLDQGPRAGNYFEASASCMFVYAAAKGVRLGYLDRGYLEVARRGFTGIIALLVAVDGEGGVHLNQVCQVAGLGGKDQRDGSFAYYVGEPVVTDDYKGVGAFILAAQEVELADRHEHR